MRRLVSRARSSWALLAALALWTPFGLETTPMRLGLPPAPLQAALAVVAGLLLLRTPLDRARRAPPTPRAMALRSVLGAVALGVATWLHVLAGGGAWFVPKFLFIGAATVLGLLLGPLAVFEHRAAQADPDRRSDGLAALLAGWGAFLGLGLGWVQARYVAEVARSGRPEAMLEEALEGAWWLTEDPGWTLRHYGWAVLPAACVTWGRLRGWPLDRQVALGLGVTGAAWGLFPGRTPAVTFGMALLAIGLPVVLGLADRAGRAAPGAEEPRPGPRRGAWLVAVVVCAAAAAGLAAREGYRAARRRAAAAVLSRDPPRWWASVAAASSACDIGAIQTEVAAVHSEALAAAAGDERRAARARLALAEANVAALAARVELEVATVDRVTGEVRDLQEQVRLNGAEADGLPPLLDALGDARASLAGRRTLVTDLTGALTSTRALLDP